MRAKCKWRNFLLLIVCNHQLFFAVVLNLLISFFSFCLCYSLDQDQLSYLMSLHPRMEATLPIGPEFYAKAAPFYTHIHSDPSFVTTTTNDLIGAIQIYETKGVAKLERVFFYAMIDYAVDFVATNYVLDCGDTLPPLEDRQMIFRTLIEYRDCEWQSTNVHRIHEALAVLNNEAATLLVDLYAFDKYYIRTLTHKD